VGGIGRIFDEAPKKIDGVLTKFLANLKNIFAKSTEADATAAKAEAEAAKRLAADRAASQAAGLSSSPFFKAGQSLGKLFGNQSGVLGDIGATIGNVFNSIPAELLRRTNVGQIDRQIEALKKERKDALDAVEFGRTIGSKDPFTLLKVGQAELASKEIRALERRKAAIQAGSGKTGSFFGFGQELIKKIQEAELKKAVKQSPQGLQADSISNIFASLVGDIQSTRLNKFRVGKEPAQRTNDLLEGISQQLGPGVNQDSYLKQIVDKTGPLVLQ
jgi:hypothetical protein